MFATPISRQIQYKKCEHEAGRKASKLLQSKMNLQACQLYRKAGNFLKAARLLFDVAAAESKKPNPIPLRVKKLYVLSALLVEQHHEQRKVSSRIFPHSILNLGSNWSIGYPWSS